MKADTASERSTTGDTLPPLEPFVDIVPPPLTTPGSYPLTSTPPRQKTTQQSPVTKGTHLKETKMF
jgi:hypothetical protein